jgi:restriction system protein
MRLDPYEFEQKVAELLIRMGYSNVDRVGGAGDRAVDITAQRKDEFGQVLRYAVQCKRYDPSSHVGSEEMQVFCSMISRVHGSDRGIYVTTASFTAEAAEIARKFAVTLVDGRLLEELLVQYV